MSTASAASGGSADISHMVQVQTESMIVVRLANAMRNLSVQDMNKLVNDYRTDSKKKQTNGVEIEAKTSFGSLSARQQWELSKWLGSLQNLTWMGFQSSSVPMEALNEILRAADQLKVLELRGRSARWGDQMEAFSKFTFAQFCDVLENHPSLEKFVFHPVIREKHTYDMMGFSDGSSPHHFRLGQVVLALSKMANLKSLDLRPKVICRQMRYSLDVSSITAIFEKSTMEELSIDVPGCHQVLVHSFEQSQKVTASLQKATNLKTLCYRDNSSHMGIAIADALVGNKSLKSVRIAQAKPKLDASATARLSQSISGALKTNDCLVELRLCKSLAGKTKDSKVSDIANALTANKTLQVLDLSGNGLAEKDFQDIAIALKSNSSLTTLDLRDNGQGFRSVFREALEENYSIVCLESGSSECEECYGDDSDEEMENMPYYVPERDPVVDFYVRLNRAGRGSLLKNDRSASNAEWLSVLLTVNAGGCNGTEDARGYYYDRDPTYYIECDLYDSFDYSGEPQVAVNRDDVASIFYLLRKDPSKFFPGTSASESPVAHDVSPSPAKKKRKILNEKASRE